MAYTNNVPQANQRIKDTQSPILNNFAAIQTVVAVNHVTFDDPSGDQGKHKFVTFPRQAADPATGLTEINLYSKLNATSARSELYISNGAGAIFPFTIAAGPVNAAWTYLPSGVILKYGTIAAGPINPSTFANGAGAPPYSTVFSIQVTALGNYTAYINGPFTNVLATLVTSIPAQNVTILIIGI